MAYDRIRVKVCGITRPADAKAAIDAGAHAVGFVFYPPSPRYVSPELAAAIISELPLFVTTVGVFVNVSWREVEDITQLTRISVIQLHGDEEPVDCSGHTRPVVKALRFMQNDLSPALSAYDVAGFLIDTGVAGKWGGTGMPLDWDLLAAQLDSHCAPVRERLILAGGLDPNNVAAAVRKVKPYAVDVSSGVEDEPGIKN
ncbi:MAG TPA: phosphoribosylanthranilate isomerase, partial [Desulfomonilaceae bacterium]|nr:phosphoribosylanthranilate isomerase [Desulfomonilaceae bacterium]